MNTNTLIDAINRFADLDIGSMDTASLEEIVRMTAVARSKLDAVEVRCARRRRHLEAAGHADTATSMFGRTARQSSTAAAQVDERTSLADALPSFEKDLGRGQIAGQHLDAIASARHGLDVETLAEFDTHEAALREHARTESVDSFARRCRQLRRRILAAAATSDADELDRQRANSRVKRWTDKVTGMGHTHLELDPVRDAALWSSIDASLATLRQMDGNARTPWEQLKVNAVVAAVTGPSREHAGDPSRPGASGAVQSRRVPEITVIVDLDT
ncbi:MAG: HNH endonuclease, partial [Ilumatobacter sp.]